MGLDINAARFLLAEKARGIEFGRTLTLGRQGIYMSEKSYESLLKILGVETLVPGFADDFFRGLGAAPLIPMDASDYEGAEIIHDMNELVAPQYHNAFDSVIDGGTLEHVFNFPTAIRNCMEMVKTGGHLVLMTPWHNYSGHGFYQFSPELIYNTLSEENGYKIETMLIVAEGNWYSVKNPSDIKNRIEISTEVPVLLYVSAKRITPNKLFLRWPQQSDYSAAWQRGNSATSDRDQSVSLKSRLCETYSVFENMRAIWRSMKYKKSLSPSMNQGLVRICPSHQIPNHY